MDHSSDTPGWTPGKPAAALLNGPGSRLLPTGPTRRDTIGFGLLLFVLLGLLTWFEVQAGGTQPLALMGAGMLVYLFICLVRLEVAFLLIVVATTFSVEMVFLGLGSALQVPTEPMLFVALGVWLLRFLSRGSTTFRQSALTGALVLALVTCLLSLYDTGYRGLGLKALANAVWYALFGVFIWNNFADRGRLKGLVVAWLLAAVVLCVYSIVNVLSGHFNPQAGFWYAYPLFMEHSTFAAWLSFACVLSLSLALETTGVKRLAFVAVAILSGIQIILSLTRGAWLGMVPALAFLAVVSGRRIFRGGTAVAIIAGGLVVVLAISMSGVNQRLERHTETITDPTYLSNLERVNRWYSGWKMFQADPLTGVGFGTYSQNYSGYRRQALATKESDLKIGVHSEYLRVLSETGLIGAAAALASAVALVLISRRILRRTRDPFLRGLSVGSMAGLITYLGHGVVNNFMMYDKAAIPIWTAIGVLGAVESLVREEDPNGRRVGAPAGR